MVLSRKTYALIKHLAKSPKQKKDNILYIKYLHKTAKI